LPRPQSVLAALLLAVPLLLAQALLAQTPRGPVKHPATETRIVFTGDILLSRNVRLQLKKQTPWKGFETLFRGAAWVGGNLEGAVGKPEDCVPRAPSPCFDIADPLLVLLKSAGFNALSVENNHAADLGDTGRNQTSSGLLQRGLLPLDFAGAPHFLQVGDATMAVIAINTVKDAAGVSAAIPSIELAQKLRLARNLANLVVVSVHWGGELLDWPSDGQRRQAEWLIDHGADLILGQHPHVVQPPECVHGKPVFFSLGNHLFDQKYPETKEGLIAECRIAHGRLTCGGWSTHTPPSSFFPELRGRNHDADRALAACTPGLSSGFSVNGIGVRPLPWKAGQPLEGIIVGAWKNGRWQWLSRRQHAVSLEAGPLAGRDQPDLLFSLERHFSPIDKEIGLRPYVYAIGPRGLVARWRGSALAWPLLDARLLPGSNRICALHRGDSFLLLDPQTKATRIAAYEWNGFGFKGVEDPEIERQCRALLMDEVQAGSVAQPVEP